MTTVLLTLTLVVRDVLVTVAYTAIHLCTVPFKTTRWIYHRRNLSPKVVLLNNYFLSQTSFEQKTETARRSNSMPPFSRDWSIVSWDSISDVATDVRPGNAAIGSIQHPTPLHCQNHHWVSLFAKLSQVCHVWMLGHIEFWWDIQDFRYYIRVMIWCHAWSNQNVCLYLYLHLYLYLLFMRVWHIEWAGRGADWAS